MITAKLLYHTPLFLVANAIRQSRQLQHKSDSIWTGSDWKLGKDDEALIKRVAFNMNHQSVLEHSMIVYEVEAPRFALQEISRHRIGISMTIKSSRYTATKDLKEEEPFVDQYGFISDEGIKRASKYLHLTPNIEINHNSVRALENLRLAIVNGVKNDIAKACMPESYMFKGQITFNLRSLVHFLGLRIEPAALWEMRLLSVEFIKQLPIQYRNLIFTDDRIFKYYQKIVNEGE